jgi:purine-binding chemotaxis protein CheW
MEKQDAPGRAGRTVKTPDGVMDQMINFSAGTEQYGVDIRRVREVIRVGEITPVPRAPHFVKGVINLRGDVIPVIDLREKLGLAAAGDLSETRVIVVEIGEKLVGMIVDTVSRVVRVGPGDLEPAPLWLGGLTGDYMAGVVRLPDRLVIVLHVEAILTSGEKLELQAMEE